jgi:F-type H+-transporting ATPase subunit epsilon
MEDTSQEPGLRLTLVTPFKKVHEDLIVDEVRLPAEQGHVTVYPDHAPMVTTLGVGILSYKKQGDSEFCHSAISWGYCEVNKGSVKLLAENVEQKESIDLEKEKKIQSNAEEALASNTLSPEEIVSRQNELKFAEAKIQLFEL